MNVREKIRSIAHQKQETIFSASLVLMISFGLSAVLGFLRNRILYGLYLQNFSDQLDAYNAAFKLPDLIFKLLVSGALSAAFTPVYAGLLHKDKAEADKTASSIINVLFLILIVLGTLAFIFAPSFVNYLFPGFPPETSQLTASLMRVLIFAQIFFLFSNFVTAILQVNQKFVIPAFSPIVYNLFIILGIFTLSPSLGIYGPAYGALIGSFFHFAIQIPVLLRQDFCYTRIIKITTGFKEIVRLTIPRSIALGLSDAQSIVIASFSSFLTPGSLSLFSLAVQFMYLPSRIFSTTVGQASLPFLSNNVAKNELDKFRNTVKRIILQTLYITAPITMLILIHRLAIIRIIFGSRDFPWEATKDTARILGYLTPAIVSQGIIQILVRSFYALHNTKTPMKISFISLLVTLASGFYFTRYTNLGVIGLAICASISDLIQLTGLLYAFIKRVDGLDWTETLYRFNKIFLATVLMGFTTWLSHRFLDTFILDTSRIFYLIILFSISSLIGCLTYLLVSVVLRINEYESFRHYLTKFKSFLLP